MTSAGSQRVLDTVAAEEPLDIRIAYRFKETRRIENLALTMRTPGHDRELVAGLLLSEGIIVNGADLLEIRLLGTEPHNEVVAELAPTVDFESWRSSRNSIVNSSCGVCGKRSRDALMLPDIIAEPKPSVVSRSFIERLPNLLNQHQQGFTQTGGLHAAALVNSAGQVEKLFEDIGRHNALDKLIGYCVLNGRIPLKDEILLLSSRSSFELVQKTGAARGSFLVTVGGPSSLAIETARQLGITLIGFLRDHRFNVYSGDWRINLEL